MSTKQKVRSCTRSFKIKLTITFICWVIVDLSLFPLPSEAVVNEILIQNDCICPGKSLQITCSVVGLGSTVWEGSTFNCPLSENKISLFHNDFVTNSAEGDCNNNNIIARGLSVIGPEQNRFVSELTLTPSPGTNGQTVTCNYDDGLSSTSVGTVTVNLTTESFRAPTSVRLTRVNNQPREFTFTWDTVESSCPSLQYRVSATGCGTCTSTSTSNTTTCMDYDVTRDQLCTFAVQTVICDAIVSVMNASIQVPLKVPDKPSFIKIVSSYSFENGTLLRLNTSFQENSSNFYISNEIDGSDTSYSVNYSNQGGGSCGSVTIPTSSEFCINGICQYVFNTSSSTACLSSNSVRVSLTAANVFGVGPMSNITNIDAINRFVDVQFDQGSSKIVCMFSESENITVNMLCTIEYAQEGSTNVVTKTSQSEGQAAEDGRRIEINLPGLGQSTTYTFVVTATNGTTTVNVEGSFTTSGGGNSLGSGAIAAIVMSIIIIIISILLSVFAVIVFVIIRKKRYKH